jgi:hypothetical protein
MRQNKYRAEFQGHVLAFIEDGPHGGETVVVDAEPDGSIPQQIKLEDPPPTLQVYEESSLRHSVPIRVSTYHLGDEAERVRGGYSYKLVNEPSKPLDQQKI